VIWVKECHKTFTTAFPYSSNFFAEELASAFAKGFLILRYCGIIAGVPSFIKLFFYAKMASDLVLLISSFFPFVVDVILSNSIYVKMLIKT
jgi:hypothetical protein